MTLLNAKVDEPFDLHTVQPELIMAEIIGSFRSTRKLSTANGGQKRVNKFLERSSCLFNVNSLISK